MELANQYGVDLGNIYSTASSLKTAQQIRDMRKTAIDKEAEATAADKAKLQEVRPGTNATSIAQQENFDKFDAETKQKLISDARATVEKHGKVALFASTLPLDQQGPYIEKYVSTLPEDEQSQFKAKYGNDDITQQIPHMINDLMTTDQLLKERADKIKHDQILEQEGVKGTIQTGIQEMKGKQAQERADTMAQAGIERSKIRASGNEGKGNVYRPKLLSYEIKTQTDPKTGDRTTVRINKYDDGTTSETPARGNALKPPPPLETQRPSKSEAVKTPMQGSTYNPKDVVRYGTKNGRKVAQMKDGSVIYVK